MLSTRDGLEWVSIVFILFDFFSRCTIFVKCRLLHVVRCYYALLSKCKVSFHPCFVKQRKASQPGNFCLSRPRSIRVQSLPRSQPESSNSGMSARFSSYTVCSSAKHKFRAAQARGRLCSVQSARTSKPTGKISNSHLPCHIARDFARRLFQKIWERPAQNLSFLFFLPAI